MTVKDPQRKGVKVGSKGAGFRDVLRDIASQKATFISHYPGFGLMRAQVTALFFLMMNILGIAGGTALVAVLTDYLFANDVMVGYSMSLISAIGAAVGAAILGWGLKYFVRTEASVSTSQHRA